MKAETTSTDGKNVIAKAPKPAVPRNNRRRSPRPHYKSGQAILDPEKCCNSEAYIEPISEEVRSVLYR